MGLSLPLFGETAVQRAPADPERPAAVIDRVRLVAVKDERLGPPLGIELGPPPAPLAACSGRVEPGPGPLADEVPLELGQGGKDMEDQLAAAGGGVDALPEAPESDPSLPESGERLDEVAE
jgi:hypothetical protein